MDTQGTARAIQAVFDVLGPHLPSGSGIRITPRRKWTVVQRADAASRDVEGFVFQMPSRDRPSSPISSGFSTRGLGPWIPFLPRELRQRLAAKNAVNMLLGLFYDPHEGDGFRRSTDYRVTVTSGDSGLILGYTLPGESEAVSLDPLPSNVFG